MKEDEVEGHVAYIGDIRNVYDCSWRISREQTFVRLGVIERVIARCILNKHSQMV
jgi:hypothetical protein